MDDITKLAQKLNLKYVVDIEPVRDAMHNPMRAEYITIHNTGSDWNGKDTHAYNRLCIRTSQDGIKSWHVSVGEDGAYQALPLNVNAWHAGDGADGPGNRRSIGIEIGRDMDYHSSLYARAEDNCARLAAALLVSKGFGVDRLRMHKDWSGKGCPHRILEAGTWEAFKTKVAGYMRQLQGPPAKPEPPKPQSPEYIYRVQVGAFSSAENAEKYKELAQKAGFEAFVVKQKR